MYQLETDANGDTVEGRLPMGQILGPIFGPPSFGMFGGGYAVGYTCHLVPPIAPVSNYWLFAEAYNTEVSARDSMAFTVTGTVGSDEYEEIWLSWQTPVAHLGDWLLTGRRVFTQLKEKPPSNDNPRYVLPCRSIIDYLKI